MKENDEVLRTVDGKRPTVPDSAWVADNAAVTGDVVLGDGASVFYGASVRGDMATITIGAGTNVQDGCALHADPGFPLTIGDGVSIGHNAVLHGATIGDNTLIGMNATVLNGASIGEGCLIAAGAVVTEGAQIPPRSLVAGLPAKVRRELSDDEVSALRVNAAAYEHLREQHRNATD